MAHRQEHWEQVWTGKSSDSMSWYQLEPSTSLRLVTGVAPPPSAVLDVGAGASTFVDRLLVGGYTDVSVLDVSAAALTQLIDRMGGDSAGVTLVRADLLDWEPSREFDVWHDRAVFHFLVEPEARQRYVEVANRALRPGGVLVLGTFAPDGPTTCSGLPVARWDEVGVAEQLRPGFRLEHSERELHVTPSGAAQPFTWTVLRRL